MDHREQILSLVKEKGPLLPGQINKELKTNVLFASAMLAEMVDQKKLRLTSMKVGGSPLYYCEGQEPLIERFADRLGGTNYSTFTLLKQSKILRDRDLEPPARVALREIKDFAVPLEVTAEGYSDLFWKYYIVGDEEAKSLIKDYIGRRMAPEAEEVPKPKEVQSTITGIDDGDGLAHAPRESEVARDTPSSVKLTPLDESAVPEFSYQSAVSFDTKIDTDEIVKIEKRKKEEPHEEEQKVIAYPEDDAFFKDVRKFFDNSGIEIVDFALLRKSSEYDFIVKIPSNVGMLNYYCKARSKSKINDADLSAAYVQGQIKKLPILYLTPGTLTKRAEELLSKEFRNMFVKNI